MKKTDHAENVQALTGEVRHLFQLLGSWGNAIHAGTGINASLRAAMEALSLHGAATVPDIALAKSVSRQHIQTIVDQLVALGLAELRSNPKHRRSPLVALTVAGKTRFAEMMRREAPFWDGLAAALTPRQAATARAALSALRAHVQTLLDSKEESRP